MNSITIEDAAKYAKVEQSIIREWIHIALLASYRVKFKLCVDFADLEVLLKFREQFDTDWRKQLERSYGNGAFKLLKQALIIHSAQTIGDLYFEQYHHRRANKHVVDAIFIPKQFYVIDKEYIEKSPKEGAYLVWYNRGRKRQENYIRIIEKSVFESIFA